MMNKKIIKKIEQQSDISEIEKHAEELVGIVCSEARLSYGDQLMIHFGIMTPYPHPALSKVKMGQWILSTCASEWQILSPKETISSSNDSLQSIERKIHYVENSKVIALKVGYPELDLTIEFDNELKFKIISNLDCEQNSDHFPEIANWEFRSPKKKYLSVWPNKTWTFE